MLVPGRLAVLAVRAVLPRTLVQVLLLLALLRVVRHNVASLQRQHFALYLELVLRVIVEQNVSNDLESSINLDNM